MKKEIIGVYACLGLSARVAQHHTHSLETDILYPTQLTQPVSFGLPLSATALSSKYSVYPLCLAACLLSCAWSVESEIFNMLRSEIGAEKTKTLCEAKLVALR